jgi:2-polyprenyl-3-methyl-5-hydroxy-6-metoxy-1,4-benzoquinol methylase
MVQVRPRVARLVRRAGLAPLSYWPAGLPGAAPVIEAAWARKLRRARAVSVHEHARDVGVRDIEEVTGCALCGGEMVQPLFRPTGATWSYHVVRCVSCGHLFRHPGIRPERLGELYANQYSKFLTGRYAKDRQRRYALAMDAFAPLFDDGARRRLFDYGCGAGLFLELAHQRGFDGYGVDLSADSIEVARTRAGGGNTHVGDPRDVPAIAAGGFDVVTLWSVLAHLPRPVDDLRMLRELLTPDGVLLLFTVNANSLLLKASGSHWGGFTTNHLMVYTPATLARLLREAGFGALVTRPHYGEVIETGELPLRRRTEQRIRRNVADGNRGHMMRAVAFNDPDGPKRWGLAADALTLQPG